MSVPKGTKPWNAGTAKGWIDHRGYLCLTKFVNGKAKKFRVHRLKMEEHLGRRLEPYEIVHHKDGNRLNNEISNLEIMTFPEHTRHHNIGAQRSDRAKSTMALQAQYREALKAEKAKVAQLAEALQNMIIHAEGLCELLAYENSGGLGFGKDFSNAAYVADRERARAILRAAGVEP